VKREFEDKKRELEERFSTLLGTPWTINPKIDAIYPYIPKNYHGNAGDVIHRYEQDSAFMQTISIFVFSS
jgi:hypothetical protein